jgi:hypothetical protein
MAYLRWRKDNGAELSGGVQSGKDVLLSGDGYDSLPKEFSIQRRFGALLRQYRERKGLPITAAVGQPLRIKPGAEKGEAMAGPWALRTPGRRLKWRLFFEDGSGNSSEELHVSRLGELRSLKLGVLETGFKIDFRFIAAIDPLVQLTVLMPWGEGKGDLHPFLRELADDVRGEGEGSDASLASLSEYLSEYLPAEQPPGWRLKANRTEFDLDEGEAAHFSIQIEAPTPGAAAFVLQMTAKVDGELLMVASDPLVVRVPEDGSQQAELLGDDDLSGGGSELDEPKQVKEPATTDALEMA